MAWFGEALPELTWLAAHEAAKQCDVFLCCGTPALVQPAASLTHVAIDGGAVTVQVNPNPIDLDTSVTAAIRGRSSTVLPSSVRIPPFPSLNQPRRDARLGRAPR
jgi:NAD-dependent protein deacetylase/lipoamidase